MKLTSAFEFHSFEGLLLPLDVTTEDRVFAVKGTEENDTF